MHPDTRRKFILPLIALLSAAEVTAQETPPSVRSFDRFEFDAATAHGLWVEAGTSFEREEEAGLSADAIIVLPRLAYGWNWGEAGLMIPYSRLHIEPFLLDVSDDDGIGDLSAYGKVLGRWGWSAATLGLDVSFPTGDEERRLGAGAVGFLPYAGLGANLGWWWATLERTDVRVHIGYRAFTRSEEAVDSLDYGGGVFGWVTDHIGVRIEFIGQRLDLTGAPNPVAFVPGIDVRVPVRAFDLLIRPTGLVGLTDSAPDWGVGGSLVLAWDPLASS